jgi:hypothetical protein
LILKLKALKQEQMLMQNVYTAKSWSDASLLHLLLLKKKLLKLKLNWTPAAEENNETQTPNLEARCVKIVST